MACEAPEPSVSDRAALRLPKERFKLWSIDKADVAAVYNIYSAISEPPWRRQQAKSGSANRHHTE